MLISSLWYKQLYWLIKFQFFLIFFCEKWFHVKKIVLHFILANFRALCNPVRCIFQFSVQFSSSDKWVLLSVGKKKLKLELCLGSLSLLIIYFHENFWTGPGRSGSTQKKSQALAKIDVFFPEKKEKKIVLKRRRPRTFYILHLPPSCIFQNYFAIKMYILCTRKNIFT